VGYGAVDSPITVRSHVLTRTDASFILAISQNPHHRLGHDFLGMSPQQQQGSHRDPAVQSEKAPGAQHVLVVEPLDRPATNPTAPERPTPPQPAGEME